MSARGGYSREMMRRPTDGLILDDLAAPQTHTTNNSTPSLPLSSSVAVRTQPLTLSKYGVAIAPPQDDALHYSSDARGIACCAKVSLSHSIQISK